MSVSISYDLTGSGWSECRIVIDDHQAVDTASYLSDAWGDLIAAVARVIAGETEATASFAKEPGEYRWRLICLQPGRLLVRILNFPQLWGDRPDEEGKIVLEAECRLRTFAGAILSASQWLLEKWDVKGYREKWGEHEFPIQQHERLERLLRG